MVGGDGHLGVPVAVGGGAGEDGGGSGGREGEEGGWEVHVDGCLGLLDRRRRICLSDGDGVSNGRRDVSYIHQTSAECHRAHPLCRNNGV